MSETDNIARMAEKVSAEVFAMFGWSSCGPRNQNWKCDVHESHGTKGRTHPSDVVFRYNDPYDAGLVYVTTDLKSYAKATIEVANVGGAVRRLAMATECANLSDEFSRLYVADHQSHPWRAVGLLFLYNHDGKYTGDFDRLLAQIDPKNYELESGRRMFLLGPRQVNYLFGVAHDISYLRGRNKIPAAAECRFYYPDLVRLTARVSKSADAASLEWLTGPWQLLQFTRPVGDNGVQTVTYVYYRDAGASTDEFKYLFDYLFRFQLVDIGSVIEVRAVPETPGLPSAKPTFEKAKSEYVAQSHPAARMDFESRLCSVRFSTVDTVVTTFSDVEIGMRDE